MDFSDRLRIKQRATIAAANVPTFKATWSTGQPTLTYVSGSTPIVGTYAKSAGIPSNTIITAVSGTTVSLNANTTTTQSLATSVAMTPSSASAPLTAYSSYESKYNTQGGLSYLTFASGTPAYSSTIGAFGCST